MNGGWGSVLPVRREILLEILNCDLIGFHTYDYARHFLSSCSRLLGLKCLPNSEAGAFLPRRHADPSHIRRRARWEVRHRRHFPDRYRARAIP